jgi:predicted nucleic-acid-binding protein
VRCRAIDANVILRFLLGEPPEQADRCQALFARLQAGEEEVYLPEVALSDVVWTLQSFYRWPRERIARFAHDVISLTDIRMNRKSLVRDALHFYVEQRIDFSDALITAEMLHGGYAEIYSYDRDFDRMTEVERVEP